MLKYTFSRTTIYDNSKCECGPNGGCIRGCLREVEKDQTPHPISKCEDNPAKDTGWCARHVLGAIMNTIHNKLAIHCKENAINTNTTARDRKQCLKQWDKGKYNICQHSFVFEHAYCALNLDGKYKDQPFSKDDITDSSVRENCNNHTKRTNEALLNFPIIKDGNRMEDVPLFERIPLDEKYKKNPESIPEGAIIVMDTDSPSGHIEIKTNKKDCGADNKQTCFCSDFCIERPKIMKIKAIFKWNDKIVNYANNL